MAARSDSRNLTYQILTTGLDGQESEDAVEVSFGKPAKIPSARRWQVFFPDSVTREQIIALVRDVSSRNPPETFISTRTTDELLPLFAEVKNLVGLHISREQNNCATDQTLKAVSQIGQIQELSFDFAVLTDAGLPHLRKLQRLASLGLVGHFSTEGIKTLAQLPALKNISMVSDLKPADLKMLLKSNSLLTAEVRSASLSAADYRSFQKELRNRRARIIDPSLAATKMDPNSLCPEISRQLVRLGASPVSQHKEMPPCTRVWPPPIRQLTYGFSWPEGRTYSDPTNPDAHSINFTIRNSMNPDEYPCLEGKPYVDIGSTSVGNFILVPLDEQDSSDPWVYIMPHDLYGNSDGERPWGPWPLSELLSRLHPDE